MTLRSQTTTDAARSGRLTPVHPGEMLREEFLIPMGLSAHALAMAIMVPGTRIAEIVKQKRGISGDTAVRLGRYFRTSPQFWMNLQSHYELEVARDNMGPGVEESIKPASIDEKTGELNALRTA